jgi:hypothetical protein
VNILIVEDDVSLSELMQMMFKECGYNFQSCISIEDAYLQLINIDVIIVDSFFGKEFPFIRFCKSKGICCIYHTGRVDITDEEYYMFDYVVEKPGFNFLFKCLSLLSDKLETAI